MQLLEEILVQDLDQAQGEGVEEVDQEEQTHDLDFEMIKDFGCLNYTIDEMNQVLGFDCAELMNDENSDFYKEYFKGKALGKFMIDKVIFNQAALGDLKAIELFRKDSNKRGR